MYQEKRAFELLESGVCAHGRDAAGSAGGADSGGGTGKLRRLRHRLCV